MKTSFDGRNFIKKHEGYRDTAYTCSAGVWTIGYGHTGNVKPGDKITQAQADAFLEADLAKFEAAVNAANIPNITQNQFDALVSFTYNVGENAFKSSTLLRLAQVNPQDTGIRAAFLKFVYVNKKQNEGLRKRREQEAELYFR